MLYATGLVAGGSLGGVLIALVAFVGDSLLHMENPTLHREARSRREVLPGLQERRSAATCSARSVFAFLCWLLVTNARKKLEA